jgi:heme-degrading monooxygenase HmoA
MFDRHRKRLDTSDMIKRIVMMGLLPGREALFLNIFEDVKKQIRNQNGCMGLEVLKSDHNGELSIWTISLWQSEEALERYRNSVLFQKTWAAVKPLFSARPQAWTLTSIEKIS